MVFHEGVERVEQLIERFSSTYSILSVRYRSPFILIAFPFWQQIPASLLDPPSPPNSLRQTCPNWSLEYPSL